MRRLYLMRHGKAQAGMPPGGGDLERALVGRGRKESRGMGAFCRDQAQPPTLILCSPSRRTVETCESFCEGFGESLPRRIVDDIYMGSPSALLVRRGRGRRQRARRPPHRPQSRHSRAGACARPARAGAGATRGSPHGSRRRRSPSSRPASTTGPRSGTGAHDWWHSRCRRRCAETLPERDLARHLRQCARSVQKSTTSRRASLASDAGNRPSASRAIAL